MWACTLQASTVCKSPRRCPRTPECTCSSSVPWTLLGIRRAPDSSCTPPEAFRSTDKCESMPACATPNSGNHLLVCRIIRSALDSTCRHLSARGQHAVSTRSATSRLLESHLARASPGWGSSTLPALHTATRSVSRFHMETLTIDELDSMKSTTQNDLYK